MAPVVIAGYGVELTLRLPIVVAHLENGTLLFGPSVEEARRGAPIKNVAVKAGTPPSGPLEGRPEGDLVRYSCGVPGATEISLGVGVSSYDHCFTARVAVGPAQWTIVTEDHEIDWPASFTLAAPAVRRQRSSYELRFGDVPDQMVTVHGPFAGTEVPPPPALVAPGMTLVGSGELPETYIVWFELWYQHADAPWKQVNYYVPGGDDIVYLVRVQGLSTTSELFAAADLLVQSLAT